MNTVKKLFALSVFTCLAACGGSNDTPSTDNGQGSVPIPQVIPLQIIGPVSSGNSDTINVNGYQLDIRNITPGYADNTVSKSALATGMNVVVTTNGTTVSSVNLNPDLAGTVSTITAETLQVNGQTIKVTTLPAGLQNGDYVLITLDSGTTNTAMAITTLQGTELPLYVEIEGTVTNLNTATQRFRIGDTEVDYAQATVTDGSLQEGIWAEVFGSYQSGYLLATEIDIEPYDHNAETEVYGVISWVNDEKNRFELSRKLQFDVASSTRFEDGTAADLVTGRTVEVTHRLLNGQLQVTEIEFKTSRDNSNNPSLRNFEVTGYMTYHNDTLTLHNHTFVITSRTHFDDNLARAQLDGILLDIEGVERDGQFQILEIERADNDSYIDLRGLVLNHQLWGYSATDNTLNIHEGKWVELECRLDGVSLSQCRLDD